LRCIVFNPNNFFTSLQGSDKSASQSSRRQLLTISGELAEAEKENQLLNFEL